MKFITIMLLFVFLPVQAMAQNVSSPSIKKGVWGFNNQMTYALNDDDRDVFEQKTRLGYGVTDRLAFTYAAEFEQKEGGSIEFENSEFRAIIGLTGDDTLINATARVLYDLDHIGDSDSVGAELLLGQRFGKWRHLFNIDTSHEVGEKSESGLELDLAWGSYYSFENFRLGGEYYVDFGSVKETQRYSNQAHQIGVSVKFDAGLIAQPFENIDLEFAYFQGVSRGADDNVFKNEIEFKF
jgi:hypothetical protein